MVTFKPIFKHLIRRFTFWLMIVWLAFLIAGAIIIGGTGNKIEFLLIWSAGFIFIMIDIIRVAKYKAEAEIEKKQKNNETLTH